MLEFMACGTPTVVAVDGLARQLVSESQAGVYVPNGNAAALAAAIIDLSRDPGARAWLGGNGREFVRRRFSRRTKALEYIGALDGIPSLSQAREHPRKHTPSAPSGPARQAGATPGVIAC